MKEKEKAGHGDHSKKGQDGHQKDEHSKGGQEGSPSIHHRTRKDSHHKPSHDGGHHKGHHHGDKSSPTTSSHPIRPRAGTLVHRDTAHSIVSGKSAHNADKRSIATSDEIQPMMGIKLENTYKLKPDFIFYETPVKQIITDVIEAQMTLKTYDPGSMSKLCVLASDMIKEKVKQQMTLPRYKIVSSVMVGERGEHDASMLVSSRCLWDQRYDNHVSVTVHKSGYYVIGMVFAVYAE
ncbi:tctex1 domain-containing protein 1-like [Mizuhopecten yessoensis]|uniref:Tctex1 domain-containing protein 1 n=1 Tax=Mizuhopecten yessoensis TaxID=6573 RepID=A0A210R095_MIZYE|nr:tctex1 domain-containing protein 1-like [Mizuhopecten yessoensis]OWF54446.1 Tctex1 domain-containing protein 1 [Mizuhopecten yessoensis]